MKHDLRAKERVLAVLDAVSSLLQIAGKSDCVECRDCEIAREFNDALDLANDRLQKYRTSPCFWPDDTAKRKWRLEDSLSSKHSPWEGMAVHAIVRLADQGLLDRLRKCECGSMYFARFSHQRFCSENCRVKHWEAQESRKEAKRKQARENYLYNKAHRRK